MLARKTLQRKAHKAILSARTVWRSYGSEGTLEMAYAWLAWTG